MRKFFLLMVVALAFSCVSCRGAGTAQAEGRGISSRGAVIYQQNGMETVLDTGDLLYLESKLSTMPRETFDPANYRLADRQEGISAQIVEEIVEDADISGGRFQETEEETDLEQECEPMVEEQESSESESAEEMPKEPGTEEETAAPREPGTEEETAAPREPETEEETAAPGEPETGEETDAVVSDGSAALPGENPPDGESREDAETPEDSPGEDVPEDGEEIETGTGIDTNKNTETEVPADPVAAPKENLPEEHTDSTDAVERIITEQ